MDAYSKCVLTAIAVLLLVIAVTSSWDFVNTVVLGRPKVPTWGDDLDMRQKEGSTESKREAYDMLRRSIPLVHVHDGKVEVSGEVSVYWRKRTTSGQV